MGYHDICTNIHDLFTSAGSSGCQLQVLRFTGVLNPQHNYSNPAVFVFLMLQHLFVFVKMYELFFTV